MMMFVSFTFVASRCHFLQTDQHVRVSPIFNILASKIPGSIFVWRENRVHMDRRLGVKKKADGTKPHREEAEESAADDRDGPTTNNPTTTKRRETRNAFSLLKQS
jgi:hypothetical protein